MNEQQMLQYEERKKKERDNKYIQERKISRGLPYIVYSKKQRIVRKYTRIWYRTLLIGKYQCAD